MSYWEKAGIEVLAKLDTKILRFLDNRNDMFRLKKLSNKDVYTFVDTGMFVEGPLEILNVLDLPSVRVGDLDKRDYIRTSPVVAVIDATDTTVTFETQGGTYLLEKI